MAVCTATFEAGVNGNNVLSTDTGSATAWNALDITATGTIKYTNVTPCHGSLCMIADSGASGGRAAPYWSTAFGTLHEHYGRIYLRIPSAPPADCLIAYFSTSGFDLKIGVGLDRKIYMTNGISELASGTTTAIPLDQWVRLEYHFIHQATGTAEWKLWLTADSSGTPDETKSDTTHDTGDTSGATDAAFGIQSAGITSWSIKLDDIVAGATGWPGPSGGATSALGTVLNTDTTWQAGGLGATLNTVTYVTGTAFGASLNTANYPPQGQN